MILAQSCSTVKYVPKDKYLLDQNYLHVEGKGVDEKEIERLIEQKPNKRILWLFRFHLGLYNMSKPGSNRWISRSLRKIGEEPVIYDDNLKEKSKQMIDLYLKNKGYYNALISDTVKFRKRTTNVYYKVKPGIPYTINKISYQVEDTALQKYIDSDTLNCLLKPKASFDIDVMQDERTRIETYIKNKGYYGFSKEYIYFEADSLSKNHSVDLLLGVKKYQYKEADGTTKNIGHPKYKLGNIKVVIEKKQVMDSSTMAKLSGSVDTLYYNNIQFIYFDKISVKPWLLANIIYLGPNQMYSLKDVEETYRNLSSLKVFKFINIVFTEINPANTDSIKTLDCRIQLASVDYQSYQTEVEITNSAGLGIAGSIVYQHKNLLRGAEIFDLKLKGGTEAIKKTSSNFLNFNNTLELGVEAKIQFPKFLLPVKNDQFIRKYNPSTTFSAAYNYMRRPEYAFNVANASFGYNWKGNKYTNFQVNPMDVNLVKLFAATKNFINWIDSSSMKYSYTDHLVSLSSFSYTFNNQRIRRNAVYYYLRFNIESAGNVIKLLCMATNAQKDTDNTYTIMRIKFAQYIKSDIDLRYYQPVNETDKIAYRVFAGIACPYGNSKAIPFEKQYFSGGANGIRAWQVRSLGPGSYVDPKKSYYPNITSDLKLEANVEYRFKLFWKLEGALFIDAGNIWSIDNNDTRKGALFTLKEFPSEIAVGTGVGARFDFSFFIFRFDYGFKLRDPAEKPGNRWAFGKHITSNFFNPTIGIGYPF
jgi:outer membrane protein assembly factor BamA